MDTFLLIKTAEDRYRITDILENAANLESVTGDDESPAEPLLVLARTDGGCTALFVNEVVVAEANTMAVIDRLVVKAAQRLSFFTWRPIGGMHD